MQAGHGDGALMAFDKALARAPNFPMALWGKGMVLYQDKKDFAGAREIFERLLKLVPRRRRTKRNYQGARRNPSRRRCAENDTASCNHGVGPNHLRHNQHRCQS